MHTPGLQMYDYLLSQEWAEGFNQILDRAQRLSHERYGAYIKLAPVSMPMS